MPEDHPAAGGRAGGAAAELLLKQTARHLQRYALLRVQIVLVFSLGVWCHVTFGTFTSADTYCFYKIPACLGYHRGLLPFVQSR